ncbi:MAG: hypothetical protein AYP45_01720 [Candidatus Brocadia carolinensis]|uniref:Uncharacterized protein n=1 Tax=Candidatus Brocadia carolinensis TaxID=1004156 RepID=A0A1V4AX68_9BACT|nr:MAG: hypothetical protein AYP45_01720 [Candidatus Brocadia caroliniensis]
MSIAKGVSPKQSLSWDCFALPAMTDRTVCHMFVFRNFKPVFLSKKMEHTPAYVGRPVWSPYNEGRFKVADKGSLIILPQSPRLRGETGGKSPNA